MKIPEIAGRIREIADEIEEDFEGLSKELKLLSEQMRRRQPSSRAPVTSTPMTDELKEEIKRFKKANPELSQQEVAERFGVNHGRVSEAIHGKRK